jgi:hypothetical protein
MAREQITWMSALSKLAEGLNMGAIAYLLMQVAPPVGWESFLTMAIVYCCGSAVLALINGVLRTTVKVLEPYT